MSQKKHFFRTCGRCAEKYDLMMDAKFRNSGSGGTAFEHASGITRLLIRNHTKGIKKQTTPTRTSMEPKECSFFAPRCKQPGWQKFMSEECPLTCANI